MRRDSNEPVFVSPFSEGNETDKDGNIKITKTMSVLKKPDGRWLRGQYGDIG